LPQAILWFLFLLIAYPPALAVTVVQNISSVEVVELYRIGVSQMPIIGGILQQLIGQPRNAAAIPNPANHPNAAATPNPANHANDSGHPD